MILPVPLGALSLLTYQIALLLTRLHFLFHAFTRRDFLVYRIATLLQKPVIDHWWQTETGCFVVVVALYFLFIYLFIYLFLLLLFFFNKFCNFFPPLNASHLTSLGWAITSSFRQVCLILVVSFIFIFCC